MTAPISSSVSSMQNHRFYLLSLGVLACVPSLLFLSGSLSQPDSVLLPLALCVGPILALPLLIMLAMAWREREDPSVRVALLILAPCLLLSAAFDLFALRSWALGSFAKELYLDFEQLGGITRSFCLVLAVVGSLSFALPKSKIKVQPGMWILLLLMTLAALQVFDLHSGFISSNLSMMAGLSLIVTLFSVVLLVRTGLAWKNPLLFALAAMAGLQAFNHLAVFWPAFHARGGELLLLQNVNDVMGTLLALPFLLNAYLRQPIRVNDQQELQQSAYEAGETAAREHILTRLSHEFRTPLNTIIGFSELLQDDAGDSQTPQQLGDLKKINEAGWNLVHLVDDMLDLSASKRSDFALRETCFDAERFMALVERTAKVLAASHLTVVSVHCPQGFGAILADENRLLQICMNLLRNALRYTRDGHISIHLYPVYENEEARIVIDVRDSGKGMKPPELKSLLDTFAQTSVADDDDLGRMNLILPLTQRLCTLMGARLTIESCYGMGTTCSVSFPDLLQESRNVQPSIVLRERQRVLMLDSGERGNEDVLKLLSHNGVELFRVQRPRSSLRLFYEKDPDFIIADARSWTPEKWTMMNSMHLHKPDCPIIFLHAEQGKNASFQETAALYFAEASHEMNLKTIERLCTEAMIQTQEEKIV